MGGTFNIQNTYISGTTPSEFNALVALTEFKISKVDALCYSTVDGLATGAYSITNGAGSCNGGTNPCCSTANSITSPATCSSSCSAFQTKLQTILDSTAQCCTQQDDGKTDLICDANNC